MNIANIVLIIIGILSAIFFHELGHFLIAKLAGVRVFEFSVGLGPKIIKKKKKQTNYNFRLIPLGGYVIIASKLVVSELQKTGDEKYFNIKKSEYLDNKGIIVKVAFFLGGISTNFLIGLGIAIFVDFLAYDRFVFDYIFKLSFKSIGRLFEELFTGKLFIKEQSQVGSLISLASNAAKTTTRIDWYYFYYINLALIAFNLLPIPPLDGYKVLEALFVKFVYKKELPKKVLIRINILGASFLGILLVLLLIGDVIKQV